MDVYEIVTNQILEKMQQGQIPWQKCWSTAKTGAPTNLVSKKEYNGINTILLGCSGYSSRYWVTFKQAQEKGGNVKKGEKSSIAVFWKMFLSTDENGKESKIPMLRYYNVFNLEQCEGIQSPPEEALPERTFTPIEEAEKIIQGFSDCPEINYVGLRACYSPLADLVKMPKKETFTSEEAFYNVLFHELGHSTGHKKRLARKEVVDRHDFGSESYSQEELTAEFTAAYLSALAGIETQIENSAAYLQSWMRALKNDKKMLIMAASRATKASDYILGKRSNQEVEA